MKKKQIIKTIGVIIGAILILVVAYILYVLLTYKRIDDNQILDITSKESVIEEPLAINKTYTALTYNIGFGAYSSDYSFFMDGGEYSRAYNKKAVIDNTKGSIELINEQDTDFALLQEVDIKSTRSYGVDQYKMVQERLSDYSSTFAMNYDSAYLMYPLLKPHGKSMSGIAIFSKHQILDAIRRSLPIDTSLYKLIDLDRCYIKSRLLVENGKYLCLYNVHLSAYTKDESIVKNQITMLIDDMKKEYDSGNFIVCGGDFNQDLLGDSPALFGTPVIENSWAKPFPEDLLPSGLSVVYDLLSDEVRASLTPTCRNADIPYDKEKSFVTTVDGFIISDNVKLDKVATIDNGFLYSDHNPVKMEFKLLQD